LSFFSSFSPPPPPPPPRLGVEAEYQPKYESDQSEQRAEHDHGAHVGTPSDTHWTLRIVDTILKRSVAECGFEE
jgi:hypothetical protein